MYWRKSVSGWIILLNVNLISWRIRQKKSVSLRSLESEYVVVSELCMDFMYLRNLLDFLGLFTPLPINIRVDNMGAMYIAENYTGRHTKHIGIHYHYVRDYIEEGTVKIKFVKLEENKSNIFTKNTPQKIHQKWTDEYFQDLRKIQDKNKGGCLD